MSASDQTPTLSPCGCFPANRLCPVHNRPGLPALAYRIGAHPAFLRRMLARLPSQTVPLDDPQGIRPLAALTTRGTDDPAIALLDAWATVADVLTFYQERIANEGFLRTATERRSVLELARAIGYELRPGVAASSFLAFTVDEAPGAVTIDIGARVQSVPRQNELPQTFETVEKLEARAPWNVLRATSTKLRVPRFGDKCAYFKGTSTSLKPGDWLLFVGEERERDPGSERWDFRMVKTVQPDYDAGRTLVTWERELGSTTPRVEPPANSKVFALRQRAAIFGHNAPEWRAAPNAMRASYLGLDDPIELMEQEKRDWPDFTILAPTAQARALAVLNREVHPTRESVAAAAQAAAHASATQAASAAATAAGKAAQDAANAAQKAVESAQRAAQAMANFVSVTAGSLTSQAVQAAGTAFGDAGALKSRIDALLAGAGQRVGALRVIANAADADSDSDPHVINLLRNPGLATSKLLSHAASIQNAILSIAAETTLDDAVVQAAKDTLTHAATAASTAAATAINAAREAASATAPLLDQLGAAAGDFARSAGEAAKGGAAAAGAEEAARIVAALVDVSLHPPPPFNPPPDAKKMADLAGAFADAAVIVVGATGVATTAAATAAAATALVPLGVVMGAAYIGMMVPVVAGAILLGAPAAAVAAAGGAAFTAAAVEGASKVRDAVKVAVDHDHALKVRTEPRPARRETYKPRGDTIDLDAVYSQITPGSWLVLSTPEYVELYQVTGVAETSRADFSLTAKATRVTLKGENLTEKFEKAVRVATVFAHSEPLDLAEGPISEPVTGDSVTLDHRVDGLPNGRLLIVSGKDSASGASVSEVATLLKAEPEGKLTKLYLDGDLGHSYQPGSVAIYANVARATHGETAREVLGSGNSAQGHQRFVLKKPPLTYVSSPAAAGGAQSTLSVRVNGTLWEEAPSLYGLDGRRQCYTARRDDDGKVSVMFGDGESGARLPSGTENVLAVYRSGIGPDGEVDASKLTTLLTRPLGLREATNPLPATGAAAPEALDDARVNAPLTVLTLERIVSLRDFEDFARAFAGIGKAQAVELWDGTGRLVHVTVAPATGGQIDPASALYVSLVNAIDAGRDPGQRVWVAGYQPSTFSLEARVLPDPRYVTEEVLATVREALRRAFAFERRSFGQPVSAAEVVTVMHGVEGVVAVALGKLSLDSQSETSSQAAALFKPLPVGATGSRPRFPPSSPSPFAERGQGGEVVARLLRREARIEWGRFATLGAAPMPVQPEAVLPARAARQDGGAVKPAELLLVNPSGIGVKEMAQ